jgi:hypothetical protein
VNFLPYAFSGFGSEWEASAKLNCNYEPITDEFYSRCWSNLSPSGNAFRAINGSSVCMNSLQIPRAATKMFDFVFWFIN